MPSLLHNRLEIDEARPLSGHDGPFAKAYSARGKSPGELEMLALVATIPLAMRADQATPMRSINHGSLLRLRDAGVVDWAPSSGRAFVFIYDMPLGERLAPRGGGAFTPMREEALVENLALPLFTGLNELARAGVFHGAVRADNVYLSDGQKAVLADALAVPPGFGQPPVYETIERAMADGMQRGAGSSADDHYALGITLLTALLGDEPLRGMDAAAILNLKLERGSYAALAPERRFSPAIVEVLRGLLADDPQQRWTYADFEMWHSGRRLTPKQSMPSKKATRPLVFAGQNYTQLRQAALALAANVPAAAATVQNDDLSRWLAHGFNEEGLTRNYDEARVHAKRAGKGPEDERLVAQACLALDPHGPIRYRGQRVFPAGLVVAMAQTVLNEQSVAPFVEIIQNEMPTRWLTLQSEKRPDIVSLIQLIERTRELMDKSGLGYGPERAVYEMSPAQPCLSPLLRPFYVMTAGQLLEALDKRQGLDPSMLLDRHSAAFLLSRDRRTSPAVMRAVETATDNVRRGQALLTLFGDLQYRHGPDKLRGLSRLLLPLADEAVRRFKNRPRQGKVREALRPAADAGNIPAMLKLVDDPATLQLDAQEYEAARLLYRASEEEIVRLSGQGSDKKILAEQAGQPLAAALSVALAFMLALFLVLRVFLAG